MYGIVSFIFQMADIVWSRFAVPLQMLFRDVPRSSFRQTTLCADQPQGLHGLDYLQLCQHFSVWAYYDVRSYQCKFMVDLISGFMLSCNIVI